MNDANNSLEALEELYFSLRNLRNEQPAGASAAQLDQLKDCYRIAQRNYFRAIQGVLRGDAALIDSLTNQLVDAQGKINDSLQGEQNFADTLQIIASAVHLGSSIAGFFV